MRRSTLGRVITARLGMLACAAFPLLACVETVPLGSECPRGVPCVDGSFPIGLDGALDAAAIAPDTSPPSPADGASDGSSLDAGRLGAAEAGVRFPALANGQFEVTSGDPGPLAFELLDPLPLGFTLAEPWAACRPGYSAVTSAKSDRSLEAPDVFATEGAVFIESELGLGTRVGGLRQTLATPLRTGERYGFRIDVRASKGARVALRLWGAYLDCVQSVELAASEELSERWTGICLRFTAPAELPQLMLLPDNLDNLAEGLGARLFLDNLRADPACE
jgi:hypothetical protein